MQEVVPSQYIDGKLVGEPLIHPLFASWPS